MHLLSFIPGSETFAVQRRNSLFALRCFVLFVSILCCRLATSGEVQRFPHAVVAADHPLASNAGIEILKRGGNVVDAAVATSFALSVVRPASCGIGGGGFMLIWNAETEKAVAIDYRERAPASATRDMYSTARDAAQPDGASRVEPHLAQ